MSFSEDPFDRTTELAALWSFAAGAIAGAVFGYYAAGLGAAALCVALGALAGPVLVFAIRGVIGIAEAIRFGEEPLDRFLLWSAAAGAIVGAVFGYFAPGPGAAVLCVVLGALAVPTLVFAIRGLVGSLVGEIIVRVVLAAILIF